MDTRLPLSADPVPDRVRTLLFATPPIDYVAETAQYWSELGFGGFLRPDIIPGWQCDAWSLDPKDPHSQHVVGEENPRFRSIRDMVYRLNDVGVRDNFIVVPFAKELPDWFDDAEWSRIARNFEHAALFAREAGFAGLALDDEYIEDQLGLNWPGYRASGISLDAIRGKARQRGREIQHAMLSTFPTMTTLHLPETFSIEGDLAKELFYGYLDVLVEEEAPGGMHVLPESTYFMQQAEWVARYGYGLDRILIDTLPSKAKAYWSRCCGIGLGLSPLGYLRFIRDENGRRLGYGGRPEVFGDRILEAGEDKSGNYSAEVFAETHAAARTASRRYVWVFSGGPVWWRMSSEQHARYGGSSIATLPLTDDFADYVETVRVPKIIDTPFYQSIDTAVRNSSTFDTLEGLGMPRKWLVTGPFTNENGVGYERVFGPEADPNPTAEYDGLFSSVRWNAVDTPFSGYVDLSRLIAGGTDICGYALVWIECTEPVDAVLRFGSDDSGRIRLNGKWIHGVDTERIGFPDEDTVPVRFEVGRNEVLLKVCNYRGGWGFYFRVTDTEGNEIPHVHFTTECE